jgi:site-specific DNA-methyltransferase (adenine-specific)
MLNDIDLRLGDCLELMKDIPDGSIDMILCDLPYGTTRNKWDSVVPFGALWDQYKRIIKENGAILLFAQPPFDKVLGSSNIKMLKYEWIWEKDNATGFLNANKMPLKKAENILVFYNKPPTYNPQKTAGKPYKCKQGSGSSSWNYNEKQGGYLTENSGDRFPTNIIKFNRDKSKYHPTQKPVALLEYLVKTYTNPGDLVLDNCMGSGSTGVACINTGRRFIGMELDQGYFDISVNRIAEAQKAVACQ